MAAGGTIKIHIVSGDLAEHAADVLVNSVSNELNLKAGPVCRALLKKAGPELEQECKQKYPNGIKKGTMARTNGYGLSCQKVYHVTMPFFNSKQSQNDRTPEQAFFKTVQMCLSQANCESRRSIAFPALGVGTLGYPPDIAAELFCDAVCDFEHNNSRISLQEVHVVVFHRDPQAHSIKCAFDNEAARPRQQNYGRELVFKLPSVYKKVPPQPVPPVVKTPSNPRPVSSALPRRGTKDFLKYLVKKDLRSPRYWTRFGASRTLDDYLIESQMDTMAEIAVDGTTFQEISKLVMDTWRRDLVGQGVDAQGLHHTSLKIKTIHRIENFTSFYAYSTCRQTILRKAITTGLTLCPLEKTVQGQEAIATVEGVKQMPPTSVLRQDLYYEVNECYLFHGTDAANIGAIIQTGLDSRLSSPDCMHGKGVYFAESSTKADQYADTPQNRSSHDRKMIVSRVCLGEPYVAVPWTKFNRAPCKQCHKDNCRIHKGSFDSVVTKSGEKLFREFVIYQPQQAYPEYVITYDRV